METNESFLLHQQEAMNPRETKTQLLFSDMDQNRALLQSNLLRKSNPLHLQQCIMWPSEIESRCPPFNNFLCILWWPTTDQNRDPFLYLQFFFYNQGSSIHVAYQGSILISSLAACGTDQAIATPPSSLIKPKPSRVLVSATQYRAFLVFVFWSSLISEDQTNTTVDFNRACGPHLMILRSIVDLQHRATLWSLQWLIFANYPWSSVILLRDVWAKLGSYSPPMFSAKGAPRVVALLCSGSFLAAMHLRSLESSSLQNCLNQNPRTNSNSGLLSYSLQWLQYNYESSERNLKAKIVKKQYLS